MRELPFKLPIVLDGATGTNIIKMGVPAGACLELWNAENPRQLTELYLHDKDLSGAVSFAGL